MKPIKKRVRASVQANDYLVRVNVDVEFERVTRNNGILTPDERDHVTATIRDRMTIALRGLPYGPDYLTAVSVR